MGMFIRRVKDMTGVVCELSATRFQSEGMVSTIEDPYTHTLPLRFQWRIQDGLCDACEIYRNGLMPCRQLLQRTEGHSHPQPDIASLASLQSLSPIFPQVEKHGLMPLKLMRRVDAKQKDTSSSA